MATTVRELSDRRGAKLFPVTRLTTAPCPSKYRETPALAFPIPKSLTPAECAVQDLADSIYSDFIRPPLETSTTGQELIDSIVALWDDYMERLHALRTFAAITKDGPFASRLRSYSASLQQDLEEFAMSLAGDPAKQEVEFAAATALRAQRLGAQINTMGPPTDQDEDRKLCMGYHGALGLYTYSTACLWAIKSGVRYHSSDVLMTIFGLLAGGAVDAYGFARNAMRIRGAPPSEPGPPVTLDEEDIGLLDEHATDAEMLIAQVERED